MSITPIFPTLVHQFKVNNFNDVRDILIKFVYDEQKNDPKGTRISNSGGGWHSRNDMHTYDNPLQTILGEILGDYFSDRDIFLSSTDPHIVGIWANINKKGCYNIKHMHPECHLSGTFYLKVPEDSGNLEMLSPNQFTQWDELSQYTDGIKNEVSFYPTYKFKPEEGSVILFPGTLLHRVEKNKSDLDRISIAFNIEFK